MPRIRIESPRDPRVAAYVDLRDKQLRRRQGRFIAEGELVVRRLLASRCTVESLLVAETQLGRVDAPPSVPIYYASLETLEAIAGFRFHRGMLGCGFRPAPSHWWSLLPPLHEPALVVVCAGVRDAENLGGILRNSAAFGTNLVLIGEGSVDPYARRVLRVSMGTVLTLNVGVSGDLAGDLARLHQEYGFHCAATVLDPEAVALTAARPPRRLALVLGNELAGVEATTQQLCQSRVTIPMSLATDSLNVAVASGIFLYHFSQLAQWYGSG